MLFDEPGVKAVEFTQRAHAPGPLSPRHRRRRRPAGPARSAGARDPAPAPLAGADHSGAGRPAAPGGRVVRRQLGRVPVLLDGPRDRPTATSRSGWRAERLRRLNPPLRVQLWIHMSTIVWTESVGCDGPKVVRNPQSRRHSSDVTRIKSGTCAICAGAYFSLHALAGNVLGPRVTVAAGRAGSSGISGENADATKGSGTR